MLLYESTATFITDLGVFWSARGSGKESMAMAVSSHWHSTPIWPPLEQITPLTALMLTIKAKLHSKRKKALINKIKHKSIRKIRKTIKIKAGKHVRTQERLLLSLVELNSDTQVDLA